jgi:hypothetical protein
MEAGIAALFDDPTRGLSSGDSFQALRKSGRVLVETY